MFSLKTNLAAIIKKQLNLTQNFHLDAKMYFECIIFKRWHQFKNIDVAHFQCKQ